MQYDIMQVEDDPDERRLLERAAKRQDLACYGVPSLQALEDSLENSSARVYVVDGNFPVSDGQAVEQNAHRAFASIRKAHPDARIVLFSSGMNAESVAREHGVNYRSKRQYTSEKLVEELKTLMG